MTLGFSIGKADDRWRKREREVMASVLAALTGFGLHAEIDRDHAVDRCSSPTTASARTACRRAASPSSASAADSLFSRCQHSDAKITEGTGGGCCPKERPDDEASSTRRVTATDRRDRLRASPAPSRRYQRAIGAKVRAPTEPATRRSTARRHGAAAAVRAGRRRCAGRAVTTRGAVTSRHACPAVIAIAYHRALGVRSLTSSRSSPPAAV